MEIQFANLPLIPPGQGTGVTFYPALSSEAIMFF
jgi:hypothetical protein